MKKQENEVRSILVIDDDRDDFELVAEAIGEIDPGISVYYLERCEDGVKYTDQSFDLVLLDINMPHHDGFSWLKGIREKGYQDLPIVMFTNSLFPDHIAKAYEEGANLYFTKPESFSYLKKGLKKLISMDWSVPFSVTASYRENGKYLTFQPE
jgi:DNA-binding response OmpR family regulator